MTAGLSEIPSLNGSLFAHSANCFSKETAVRTALKKKINGWYQLSAFVRSTLDAHFEYAPAASVVLRGK